jgi:hypothetical protein
MTQNNIRGRPALAEPGYRPGLEGLRGPIAAATCQQDILPGQGAAAGHRAGKPWAFAAAGAAATAIPAGPGLALAAAGHPQTAVPLLISSSVIAIVSIIAGAAARIYDSRQCTRRLEIQHAGPNALAEAMARCIDHTHAAAEGIPAGQRAAEAARARASAGQAVAEMVPAMLAAMGQQTSGATRQRRSARPAAAIPPSGGRTAAIPAGPTP